MNDNDLQDVVENLDYQSYEFTGKTILITGAAGFLGRNFVEYFDEITSYLLGEPCRVIAIDSLIAASTKSNQIITKNIVNGNVVDFLGTYSANKIDYIINAAGIASPEQYQKYPLETLDVCYSGTRNMLEFLRQQGSGRMLYFSSSEIYGNPDDKNVPTKETYKGIVSSTGPRACYDEGKRVGEALCTTYHKKYGVDVSIVRPFNIYGPGMSDNDHRVIPNFAHCIKNSDTILIHGHGAQTRTYCYVTDGIVGFLKVLLEGVAGEAYNIGNDTPEITVKELAAKMIYLSTFSPIVPKIKLIDYPKTYPADEPMRRCPDLTKAREGLGYYPHISLKEGLKRYFKTIGI